MQDFTSLCSRPSENRNANHPSSVSDLLSRSLSLKTLTPPSTILCPGLLIPIPMTGLTIPTIHTQKSPLIQNQNTSGGCNKLTCGHRYIRHVTPTAARQASKSISVNAYEMGYTGEPCTTLC